MMLQNVSANALDPVWRRKELLGAGLAFGVAISVAVGIIAFGFRFPGRFLVIALNVLVGATLLAVVLLARRSVGVGRGLAALAGLLAFVTGMIVALVSPPDWNWARVALGAADVVASGLALAASGMFELAPRHMRQDLRSHRRVVGLFLGLWLAYQVIAVLAWFGFVQADPDLIGNAGWFPILFSILVGWWRNRPAARPGEGPIADSLLGGGLVGLLVMLVSSIGGVTLSVIDDLVSGALVFSWEGMAIVTAMIAIFATIGFMLGAVGGLIGAGLAAIWRRWHDRGGPAAYAGTP